MGYIMHEVVVATVFAASANQLASVERGLVAIVKQAAQEDYMTNWHNIFVGPVESPINGHKTWIMFPDGSKEGWIGSQIGDQAREDFKDLLRGTFEYVDICHVAYGGDHKYEVGTTIVDDKYEED